MLKVNVATVLIFWQCWVNSEVDMHIEFEFLAFEVVSAMAHWHESIP